MVLESTSRLPEICCDLFLNAKYVFTIVPNFVLCFHLSGFPKVYKLPVPRNLDLPLSHITLSHWVQLLDLGVLFSFFQVFI